MGRLPPPFKIFIIYLIIGGFWIIFSDKITYLIFREPDLYLLVQHFKGIFYILTSGIIFMFIINFYFKRLEEEKEKLESIIKNSPLAIFISEDSKIIFLNPSLLKILGYSEEEIKEKKLEDLISKEEIENFKSKSKETLEGKINNFSSKFLRKDGEIIDVEIWQIKLKIKNKKKLLNICVDITEKLKLIEEKEKLKEYYYEISKTEAIGKIASGIVHDFNNLLTAIYGFSELSLMEIGEKHPVSNNLKEIINLVERGSNLTRNLLVFSKRINPEFMPLNLKEIVPDFVKILKRVIGEKIKIEIGLDENLWYIYGDRTNIEQVIMNMATNARDAMLPEGGVFKIKAENKIIDDKKFVCITFEDTGKGISEENKTKIFDDFFTTKERGTGLGLYICENIVKKHNGFIKLESEVGKGTKFFVYFPAYFYKKETEGIEEKYKVEINGKNRKVLILEDEEDIRNILSKLLTSHNFEVFSLSTAREAEKLLEKNIKFDIVLSDHGLPDKSGMEICEKIKNKIPEAKIILITGYIDAVLKEKTLKEKGFHLIFKPFTPSEVLDLIKTISL
ncbi:MAG: ATP-binding protein [candidate division WOR-3 bacterium]